MTSSGASNRTVDDERFASAAVWTRRWWTGLDRGWQASVLGVLAVAVVAAV